MYQLCFERIPFFRHTDQKSPPPLVFQNATNLIIFEALLIGAGPLGVLYFGWTAIIAAHSDAKVIIVTQFNNLRLRDKAQQAGAIDFVLKEQFWDIQRVIESYKN